MDEESEIHPVAVFVNINLAVPAVNPVMSPAFVIPATVGLEEVHVPPVCGVICVLPPIQMDEGPEMEITGLAWTVTGPVGSELHP
jgi:hypothetical protein